MKDLDDVVGGLYSQTITEILVLVREARVRIGILSDLVTVRIYYDCRAAEPYRYELSAVMKISPGSSPRGFGESAPTEAEALRRAVRRLTQEYEDAVRRGEMPDDGWLVAVER